MWSWTIYASLIIASSLLVAADDNANYKQQQPQQQENGDNLNLQAQPRLQLPVEPDSIVFGSEAQQRNYQPGFGSTYNLDNAAQTDPYVIEYKYHDYEKMTRFLRETSSRFPSLTALYSIGKSVQGIYIFSFNF